MGKQSLVSIVSKLLAANADINTRSNTGGTTFKLMAAAFQENGAMVHCLMQHAARCRCFPQEQSGKDRQTTTAVANNNGHKNVAKFMLRITIKCGWTVTAVGRRELKLTMQTR